MLSLALPPSSRIHISKAALDNLNDTYEVEPRHSPDSLADRDPFLIDNNIETFLIVRKLKQASNNKPSSPTTPTANQVSKERATRCLAMSELPVPDIKPF